MIRAATPLMTMPFIHFCMVDLRPHFGEPGVELDLELVEARIVVCHGLSGSLGLLLGMLRLPSELQSSTTMTAILLSRVAGSIP